MWAAYEIHMAWFDLEHVLEYWDVDPEQKWKKIV